MESALTNKSVDRNAPMFRTRGQRGRGVGLARGKATVNRARGQRRG
jgi:small nuclear ribonucleoprotein D3